MNGLTSEKEKWEYFHRAADSVRQSLDDFARGYVEPLELYRTVLILLDISGRLTDDPASFFKVWKRRQRPAWPKIKESPRPPREQAKAADNFLFALSDLEGVVMYGKAAGMDSVREEVEACFERFLLTYDECFPMAFEDWFYHQLQVDPPASPTREGGPSMRP